MTGSRELALLPRGPERRRRLLGALLGVRLLLLTAATLAAVAFAAVAGYDSTIDRRYRPRRGRRCADRRAIHAHASTRGGAAKRPSNAQRDPQAGDPHDRRIGPCCRRGGSRPILRRPDPRGGRGRPGRSAISRRAVGPGVAVVFTGGPSAPGDRGPPRGARIDRHRLLCADPDRARLTAHLRLRNWPLRHVGPTEMLGGIALARRGRDSACRDRCRSR